VTSFAFTAAITVGVTLVISSFTKLRSADSFVEAVKQYRILPDPLAPVYARTVPPVELLCGLALLSGITPALTGAITLGLLLSFSVGVVTNLVRGRRLDCHCFGPNSGDQLGWVTVVRLAVLLASAMTVAFLRGTDLIVQPPGDYLPAALSGLGLLLMLYILPSAPAQWHIWQLSAAPGTKPTGGRVSLHYQPLTAKVERLT